MALYQWQPFAMNTDWLSVAALNQGAHNSVQQVFQTVTPVTAISALPIGASGVISTEICHVTVTAGIGPSTITFAHGLLHTPTMCWIVPELAEGTTPAVFVGAVISDFNATNIVITVSTAGVYDVYYV